MDVELGGPRGSDLYNPGRSGRDIRSACSMRGVVADGNAIMNQEQREQSEGGVGRRVLVGQGLALGALFLAGCGKTRTAARPPLPGSSSPVVSTYVPPAPVVTEAPAAMPGLSVMPRSSWTRSGIAKPNECYSINGVNRLTVHHDGMPPVALRGQADAARRIESIRSSHVNSRGFADIGYHYIIDPTGRVWEGRPSWKQGAHVKDQNEHNIGILVLGNFDVQRPTPQALASLDQFLAMQMQKYSVRLNNVYTHKEIGQSQCPGTNLQRYMVQTRSSGGRLAAAARRLG